MSFLMLWHALIEINVLIVQGLGYGIHWNLGSQDKYIELVFDLSVNVELEFEVPRLPQREGLINIYCEIVLTEIDVHCILHAQK